MRERSRLSSRKQNFIRRTRANCMREARQISSRGNDIAPDAGREHSLLPNIIERNGRAKVNQTIEAKNKALVLEAFDTLFNKRDYAAAERYWSPHYIQHIAQDR